MGSTFSIEQTMMQLSLRSRTTSISNSFQPSRAAERERRPDNGRKTYRLLLLECLLEGVRDFGPGHLEADLGHGIPEQFAVLGHVDGLARGRNHLDVVLFENALTREVEGAVERRLTAHRRQQCIRALLGDDALDDGPVDRLDVDRIGHVRVGHDRGRIRVHENDSIAFLAQRLAGLCA